MTLTQAYGVLGADTQYPRRYDPSLLYPIARRVGRQAIGWQSEQLAIGVDWWHAFEVSWLNPQGVSEVAMARLTVPADSDNIIESKSLKLYLNGLNFTEFASWQMVQDTIATDLSRCAGAEVVVALFAVSQEAGKTGQSPMSLESPIGECIDTALSNHTGKVALTTHPEPSLLATSDTSGGAMVEYCYYSDLLRSNCPVTNQPDWGTVSIQMTTNCTVNPEQILHYILSYRQHNGFHEQCVEQIFADLSRYYTPASLLVRAWYTRRGGIDINPCRVSDKRLLPQPSRLIRQ